eukprot:jgi/Chrzof1/265/Cz01g09080.t1
MSQTTSMYEAPTYQSEVLGKGIRVYWPKEKKWFTGKVERYDPTSGKHTSKNSPTKQLTLLHVQEAFASLGFCCQLAAAQPPSTL